jgi:hypothetical protein
MGSWGGWGVLGGMEGLEYAQDVFLVLLQSPEVAA